MAKTALMVALVALMVLTFVGQSLGAPASDGLATITTNPKAVLTSLNTELNVQGLNGKKKKLLGFVGGELGRSASAKLAAERGGQSKGQ